MGSKPNTSITRGLSQEGKQGQPQDTESHPVPALEAAHPTQLSPGKEKSSSELTSCSPQPAAHSLGHGPLQAGPWTLCWSLCWPDRAGDKGSFSTRLWRQSGGGGGTGEGSWGDTNPGWPLTSLHKQPQLLGLTA